MAKQQGPVKTRTSKPFTDSAVRSRRRTIRLLRDAIEFEANEERRYALAEKLDELEAEEEDEALLIEGEQGPTHH